MVVLSTSNENEYIVNGKKVKEELGAEFPDNAEEQLFGGIKAVFKSWNGKKFITTKYCKKT